MKRRAFVVLLTAALLVGLIPGSVLAENDHFEVQETEMIDPPEQDEDSAYTEEEPGTNLNVLEQEEKDSEAKANELMLYALSSGNRQTVRWTYSSISYSEFYVTAYDQDSEKELSFDLTYSKTDAAEEVSIDLTELTNNVTNINDGTNLYDYSYATVFGIDNDDNSHKSEESYWQTLGSQGQPVTRLSISHTQMSGYALWGYSAYSGDDLLGTIKVRAHDDDNYPYIYLQLWCSRTDPIPVVAENVDTGVEYTKLETAIGEASAGDTIQLMADLDVGIEKTDEFTIDKDLTLDLNEKTISVSSNNNSYRLFHIVSGVEATIKNGIVDGGESKASGNAIFGDGKSSALTDVILKNLTVQNFGASSDYGTVYVYDGSLTATDCTFSDNENSAITMRSSAGDADLYDGTALTLEDCLICGNVNSTNNYGGGVGIRQISKAAVSGCTITNNQFKSTPSGIYGGGGIILYNVGEVTLDNNTITENQSSMYGGGLLILSGSSFHSGDRTSIANNTISDNTADSNGGGLAYYINTETHDGEASCVYKGNTVDDNYSYTRGGGMSMYSNDSDFTFTILSGTVNNNQALDSGGGIDFAWERPATLRLYSALITGNMAVKGGGVWLCPTSETIMHVTFGGAIYRNEASVSSFDEESCGDEIRFEGDSYGDSNDKVMVNIASRALGGTRMDWYTDEYGARYHDGLGTFIDVTSPEYTNRTEAFSVHGDLSESGITLAQEEAVTVISNNEAEQGYGGGIASNAVLEFGEEDTEVTVVKKWKDKNGEEIAGDIPEDSIDVTLVRVAEDGTKADLETVTLREGNDWSWTFKELPSNYTYEAREETEVSGYVASYETAVDEDGTAHITITNTMETKEVRGCKIWEDHEDADGIRPDSIQIRLYADGIEVDSRTVTADQDWKWRFTGLDKYQSDGTTEIYYTITEDPVDGYETIYNDENYNVTNKHTSGQPNPTPGTPGPDTGSPYLDTGTKPGLTTVKTGDTNHIGLWLAIMAVSAVGIAGYVVMVLRRRKRV